MIDIAVLGLLKEHDLHGYELRKRLNELPGSRPTVSFGSLYPALGRLEKAGYVKAVTFQTSAVPAAPMSGSLAGELAAFRALRRSSGSAGSEQGGRGSRGKKVYGLTDRGEERLLELLAEAGVADDRDFEVRLAFCHLLTPTQRLALFRNRREELVRRRDQNQQAGTGRRLTTYLRSLLDHDSDAVTADLAWIDRLITAEADQVDDHSNDRGDIR
jgi:DNA-binding PadR family transcriptional regulator